MFSGRHKIVKNEEGRVFIDRDGKMFRFILDFLRNGEWDFPDDPYLKKKILQVCSDNCKICGQRQEIDYYSLPLVEKKAATESPGVGSLRVVDFSLSDNQLWQFDQNRRYDFF
jgi:hypothetical protein